MSGVPATGPRPKREVVRWNAFDLRGGSWKKYEKDYQDRGIADKVRADIVPNNGALDDHTLELTQKVDGRVVVKATLVLSPDGKSITTTTTDGATTAKTVYSKRSS